MIPNVVRGERMSGLMMYLVGPGKTNEHTEPHLIAGDPALLAWHDDAELDREAALGIARHLERPRSAYGVNVNGGHVWHCSLSIGAEEGLLTDEKWQDIANDFIHAMGFDDHEGTKAPCRWVAVRHGVSKNGNDHIHLAVNLVREDGTKASIHNDFRRSQSAARALEVKYGLEQLESVKAERATRGYDPAERESLARRRAKAKYERQHAAQDEQPASWENLTKAEKAAHVNDARARMADLQERQVRKPPNDLQFRGLTADDTALAPRRSWPGPVLTASHATVAGRLKPTSLTVGAGEKWLVTGPNGSGKSTLLHLLAGDLAPTSGTINRPTGLSVGHLTQEVQLLNPQYRGSGRTVRQVYEDLIGMERAEQVPLATFGLIAGRDENRPLRVLSVGQQRRVALAGLLANPPDVLLLDEPTNHLSLLLVTQLEAAIPDYPGSVVIASHDRWLRRTWTGQHLDLNGT
ncbi:ATP-binding cassette domain-containing protein [Arthrobacter citreus]|uniref:ATP-binding cassette domain-containing protein n=1 Tax=Arthrobacter citreus TaxID=1670 RepID=UPI0036D8FD75